MMNDIFIEELAHRAMGKSPEDTEIALEAETTDEDLFEKYGIEYEQYAAIVRDLIKFTPLIESQLSKRIFHAFVDVESSRAIVKVEYKKVKG